MRDVLHIIEERDADMHSRLSEVISSVNATVAEAITAADPSVEIVMQQSSDLEQEMELMMAEDEAELEESLVKLEKMSFADPLDYMPPVVYQPAPISSINTDDDDISDLGSGLLEYAAEVLESMTMEPEIMTLSISNQPIASAVHKMPSSQEGLPTGLIACVFMLMSLFGVIMWTIGRQASRQYSSGTRR